LTSKLISYVLGCVFILSFAHQLRATDPQGDSRPPREKVSGNKVPEGYRAPHSSLMFGVNTEVAEEESPKTRQRKKAPKKAGDNNQGTFPRFDTLQTKTLLKSLESISMESPTPESKASSSSPTKKEKLKPSSASSSPKTRAKQPVRSRVPETRDVPLPEEASSAPQFPAEVETAASPSQAPNRREITTLDVATFMPSAPVKQTAPTTETKEKATSSSPKVKEKKEKSAKKGSKKEEIPQAAPSAASPAKNRIGEKNYTFDQICKMMESKLPETKPETPLRQAKDIFAPPELEPAYALLALAIGFKIVKKKNPVTDTEQDRTQYHMIYIRKLRMLMYYKMMEAGELDAFKEKLLFDTYSQTEEVKILLALIGIKEEEDFAKIINSTLMQKADSVLNQFTQKYWLKTGLRLKREDFDKRPLGPTMGGNYKGNFGSYVLEDREGNPVQGFQVKFAFCISKEEEI